MTNFPNSPVTAQAHLLKGIALEKTSNRDAAAKEFHAVTQQYAGTQEALVANAQINQLELKTTIAPKLDLPKDPAPTGPDPAALATLRAQGDFIGMWQSTQPVIANAGFCSLNMEVRLENDGFSAFPQYQCYRDSFSTDIQELMRKNPVEAMRKLQIQTAPITAVLKGAWDKDYHSLIFHTEADTTGTQCTYIGDFKVTPFGGQRIAADWTDSCRERHQFLLQRMPPQRGQQ